MQIPTMGQLLEAGVHFGHQVRKWHPEMAKFIFSTKDGVHIIDLEKTVDELGKACKFLAEIAKNGGKILFLGTKRQAQEIVKSEAKRTGMPVIYERWVGGLITNFSEIYKNIEKLANLEAKRVSGELDKYTKKEKLLIDREVAKLEKLYGGLRDLDKVPDAIFVVDVRAEETACREAKRKGIPVVAICDTNAKLDLVDFPIPGNDDAVKSIKILVQTVADAIVEGREGIKETKERKETREIKVAEEVREQKVEEPKVKKAKPKAKKERSKQK